MCPNFLNAKPDWWLYVLIGIFLVHGTLLFLGQNFKTSRLPFADESTFWYSAAQKMLDAGSFAAQQVKYPGGGLHPFGVPFLNAFPGMLVHWTSRMLPFYMPVYIILGLTLVLLEFVAAQRSKWGIVFFLVAWFGSFNNKTWAGSLVYSMVYGDSVSMVFVLSLLVWLVIHQPRAIARTLPGTVFLLGLLGLTKFPLIFLSIAFFIVFIMRYWDKIRGLGKLLLMTVIFMTPFIVWKLFEIKYAWRIAFIEKVTCKSLFLPNLDMLQRVIHNIAVDAQHLWYYFLIAVGTSCFFSKQWRYGWPVLLWVLYLIIYYGYIYKYGLIGQGDPGSGLRYLLPAVAGFFFLGANGAVGLVDTIQRQRNQLLRAGLYFIFLAIILYKLF